MSKQVRFSGLDGEELERVLARGIDHGGNVIEPFVDEETWPLRCCLCQSKPNERIAIIAWSPFPWKGAFSEVGPIVIHVEPCDRLTNAEGLPTEFDAKPMVLRPYGQDRRITYEQVQYVEAGESLTQCVLGILDDEAIEFVHGRNVVGGCYSFTASSRDAAL